jgi:hypothetical protein
LLRFAAGADAATSSSSIVMGDAPARRDFLRFGAAPAVAVAALEEYALDAAEDDDDGACETGCCEGIFTCSCGAGPRAD